MLPPFHSFGFTINTICPLILPLKAAYTPDPSDARTITSVIKHTKAQIVAGTPTFLRMILKAGTKESLESVETMIAGAEKCSEEVFDLIQAKIPNATLIEGYGITECSPIISVNPLDAPKRGSVGKPIPSLKTLISDLNTYEPLPATKEGMIMVSGESVFGGYIDESIKSPFREIDGEQYYETGDLGYLDDEWYLFITGRLKRFVKIAGEMISLPAIESVLLEWAKDAHSVTEGIPLAVEAKEIDGEVKIVVFSTIQATREEVNHHLHTHGIPALVKIAYVELVDMIPVLGTGKTDYRTLKDRITNTPKPLVTLSAITDSSDIESIVIQKIAEIAHMSPENLQRQSRFGVDIVLDSLDVGELSVFVRTHYPQTQWVDITSIKTIEDLIHKINPHA